MNIYIGNISPRVREAELYLLFEGQGLGKILFIKPGDPDNEERRGYAIVAIERDEQARVASQVLNGKRLKGIPLIVRTVDEQNWNHMVMQQNRSTVPKTRIYG